MSVPLPWLIVGLPFLAAVALGLIGSRRFGACLHAGAASALFVLTCFLQWHRFGSPEVHLAWLTSLVAMTASWCGHRSGERQPSRWLLPACQVLTGATLLALFATSPALTWLSLVFAVAAGVIVADAQHQVQLFAGGLMLALFGTLLLYLAAEPAAGSLTWHSLTSVPAHADGALLPLACVTMLLGYGTVAAMSSGAISASSVLLNVPLLVILRLSTADAASPSFANLLIAFGLAILCATAWDRTPQRGSQRLSTRAGVAQIGLVMLAFGLGGSAALLAGWCAWTVLALVRSALLQCESRPRTQALARTQTVSALALPALLLFTLLLMAGAIVGRSPWLMLPIGLAIALACFALIESLPVPGPRVGPTPADTLGLLPIWLQLALALVLAIATPTAGLDWFRALAAAG